MPMPARIELEDDVDESEDLNGQRDDVRRRIRDLATSPDEGTAATCGISTAPLHPRDPSNARQGRKFWRFLRPRS
jgi:hypothetical protein